MLLLSIVGALMVAESVRAIIRARQGKPVELRRPGSHTWIHGLPFKLRFKRSRIYVSAIPVWGIGFFIGFIGAVMGIGGGFLLVPMLIYLLRVPTATVIGTSMVLTLVTMASATVMHAATNHLVDAVLALILMVGGVTGAQFGARAGQKMRGERLRLLLGLLVLAVGIRFALDLVLPPENLYSIRPLDDRAMRRRLRLCCLLRSRSARSPGRRCRPTAERLIASLSNHRVMVTSNFTGDELVLFGGIEQDAASRPRRGGYDIVVTVTGPRQTVVTFRKARVLGIWVNADSRVFENAPSYLAVLSNRPLDAIANAETLRRLQLGLDNIPLPQRASVNIADAASDDPFRLAFIKLKTEHGLYREASNGVTFLTPVAVPRLDPAAGRGAGRDLRGRREAVRRRRADRARAGPVRSLQVRASSSSSPSAARDHGLLYGLATAMMALATGWFASVVFRRD